MKKNEVNKIARELFFETLAKLDRNDLVDFFQDLASSKEINNLSRRLLVAGLRYHGLTFDLISQVTGCSAGTINKVHFKTKGSQVLYDLLGKSEIINNNISNTNQPEIDPDPLSRRLKTRTKRALFLE